MGYDKALIMIDGVPMLRRTWDIACQCSSQAYVITPWVRRYQGIIPTSGLILETPLPGESESHGPLIGFWQGLHYVSTEWVLLLACDLPNVQADMLSRWLGELKALPDEVIACLPRHTKGWEPLCGFYRRSCHSALGSFIESGGRSFQRWLSSQTVQALEVRDPHMLMNCNTPDELRQAIADYHSIEFQQ